MIFAFILLICYIMSIDCLCEIILDHWILFGHDILCMMYDNIYMMYDILAKLIDSNFQYFDKDLCICIHQEFQPIATFVLLYLNLILLSE